MFFDLFRKRNRPPARTASGYTKAKRPRQRCDHQHSGKQRKEPAEQPKQTALRHARGSVGADSQSHEYSAIPSRSAVNRRESARAAALAGHSPYTSTARGTVRSPFQNRFLWLCLVPPGLPRCHPFHRTRESALVEPSECRNLLLSRSGCNRRGGLCAKVPPDLSGEPIP